MPIMVMNPEPATFENLLQYTLEPVVYSLSSMRALKGYLNSQGIQQFPIHIELETGMNRLGMTATDLLELESFLVNDTFKVQSIFTHLVGSEDPQLDHFTQSQIGLYASMVAKIKKYLTYPFLQHVANTTGISRHSSFKMDMVRLGIGLYGVDSNMDGLEEVSSLKTTIAQLKHLNKGDTVGYGRRGQVERDSVIATVRIGYADGYPRSLSGGNGKMLVHGQWAPVMGSVCMDMTMIDVTDIPQVKEGDSVIVFGKGLSVATVAQWAGTIPYEILTGVSQRVKRVYFEE
jgi:alanine racemase